MAPIYVLALIIAMLFTGVIYSATRGDRNNNPGNIKNVPSQRWQGQVPCRSIGQPKETVFACFADKEEGYRALAILLFNYRDLYGLNTVRKIISRYAPENENHTENYIEFICDKLGWEPDAQLDMDALDVADLIMYIVWYESLIMPNYPQLYSIVQEVDRERSK